MSDGRYMCKKKERGVESSYITRVAQLKLPINKDALGLTRRE